jgi:PKD repeat protein
MLFARSTSKYGIRSGRRSVAADRKSPFRDLKARIGAFLAVCVVAATPAFAGLGGSVVPSYPTPISVGDTKTATITLTNNATASNATENMRVSGIFFTPSCAASNGFSCTVPDVGVFQFATVVGDTGSSCENTLFTIGQANPNTGEFQLIPPANNPVLLGPSSGGGPLPSECVIVINFKVLRAPQDSTPNTPQVTTVSLARATLVGATSGYTGNAAGASTIVVNTVTNRPPVAVAGPNLSTQTLTPVAFNGSGSTDSDGTIVSYAWTFGDGASATGVSPSHSYATAGSYIVTLTVTDNAGATATASITVTVANRPPVAAAGPNQSVPTQAPVLFNGSGSSDPDGTIVSYAWTFGDGGSASGVSVSHAYASAGNYTATLTVTDNSGATASASATITVTNPVPATGDYRWSAQYGGTGGASVVSYSTAVDASGNVFIAGALWGTVNLGGGPLTSAGSSDMFVAKYSPTGAHIWSKRFGASGDDVAQSIAVDSSGNVIVVGSFKGTVNFGGSALTAYLSPFGAPTTDLFMVKFSSAGNHLWSKSFGSFGDDIGYSVAFDGSGNVLVGGVFVGHVDFGGTTLVSNNNSPDMFLAKYTAGGQLVWAKSWGNGGTDTIYGVAVDATGNVFMTGAFSGTIDFGGGPLTAISASSDIVLAKFSATGQHVWSKRFGNGAQAVGYSVAADPLGNVAFTGYFQGIVNFGGGSIASHGQLDTFVAKYSATGTHLWSFALGGTNADEGFGIAMDAGGNVVIVGTFQGTADFGTGPLTSSGSWDIVVAKYSAAGAPLWSKNLGGTNVDLAYSVAIDAAGNSTVSGYFQSTVDFGGGPVTAIGSSDVYLVNFAP